MAVPQRTEIRRHRGAMHIEQRHSIVAAEQLAAAQGGVVSRAQLRDLGVDRFDVRRELGRGRWARRGRNTVAVHRGALPRIAIWRTALWEVGAGARLDGTTALAAAGLTGFDDSIHVSIKHGRAARDAPTGVRIHRLRTWSATHTIARSGLPVARPAVAAINAATWAASSRQAALVLLMAVEQRIVTGNALAAELAARSRLPRRALIEAAVADICRGAMSMGELDVARACRRRGLPEPSRQVIRRGHRGRVYLDVYFDDFDVVVEIEGIQHHIAENAVDDALRQNEISVGTTSVLRIPLLGWRTDPEPFLDQIERALMARGWSR